MVTLMSFRNRLFYVGAPLFPKIIIYIFFSIFKFYCRISIGTGENAIYGCTKNQFFHRQYFPLEKSTYILVIGTGFCRMM